MEIATMSYQQMPSLGHRIVWTWTAYEVRCRGGRERGGERERERMLLNFNDDDSLKAFSKNRHNETWHNNT